MYVTQYQSMWNNISFFVSLNVCSLSSCSQLQKEQSKEGKLRPRLPKRLTC